MSSTANGSHHTSRNSPKPQYRPQPESTASYLTFPVSHVVSGLYRRLTEPSSPPLAQSATMATQFSNKPLYNPPHRTASPFAPPPLTGLTLRGARASNFPSRQVLTKTLAEEIRLLLPPRLQLSTDWTMAYSIEQDGVSLATLYEKCASFKASRSGFVLVVNDSLGGIFGAFLTEAPHPSSSYYGTGECFLWRATVLPTASILANLPPPPSADTTNMASRSTTIASGNPTPSSRSPRTSTPTTLLSPWSPKSPNGTPLPQTSSGISTPERIRFKAFPYSGVNDYMIFCEHDYISVGGGDGKYGLWLDGVLERGVSAPCLTFGNEALSEEGEKFEVVGVEVWYIGS